MDTESKRLTVANIGTHDSYYRPITLERVAAAVINSDWHYSWHWERDRTKTWEPLSLTGWKTAYNDGQRLLTSLVEHANRIREVLPLIEAEIERLEKWQAELEKEETDDGPERDSDRQPPTGDRIGDDLGRVQGDAGP